MMLRALATHLRKAAGGNSILQGAPLRHYASEGASSPVYVIFGAAGAVGSDLVSRLAQQQGATVVASDRDHADLEQVKSATEMLPADVQDEEAVKSVLEKAAEKFGKVDGVADCAGSALIKPAHLTSAEEFHDAMAQNVLSAFNILKASVGPMRKTGGGSIVFNGSAIAHKGYANHDVMAAAKGAVAGLTVSAASTYSPDNIRVNLVVPGLLYSEDQAHSAAQTRAKMTAKLAESDSARDASERMIALGRLGDAHDVARAIEFLLHPDSCYITGTSLHVDGGLGNIAPAEAGDSKQA